MFEFLMFLFILYSLCQPPVKDILFFLMPRLTRISAALRQKMFDLITTTTAASNNERKKRAGVEEESLSAVNF